MAETTVSEDDQLENNMFARSRDKDTRQGRTGQTQQAESEMHDGGEYSKSYTHSTRLADACNIEYLEPTIIITVARADKMSRSAPPACAIKTVHSTQLDAPE